MIDEKSMKVCRPGGPFLRQARVYNGHHRMQGLQFQQTMGLNGMIAVFFWPVAEARHDEAVSRTSQFNQRLAAVAQVCLSNTATIETKGMLHAVTGMSHIEELTFHRHCSTPTAS